MPSFETHCAQATATFGKSHEEVHLWLDEFAGTSPYGSRHRRARHHLAGIEQVRAQWGDEAADVARQHILADLTSEGWRESRDPFPKDEADFVKMGLW
jgi:hypothetical protein